MTTEAAQDSGTPGGAAAVAPAAAPTAPASVELGQSFDQAPADADNFFQIMLHQDHGDPAGIHFADRIHLLRGFGLVQPGEGFVEQNNSRIHHQGARHLQTLQLAQRQ